MKNTLKRLLALSFLSLIAVSAFAAAAPDDDACTIDLGAIYGAAAASDSIIGPNGQQISMPDFDTEYAWYIYLSMVEAMNN